MAGWPGSVPPVMIRGFYSFENDVLYSYTILPLQHTGFRTYFNAQYTFRKGLDAWFRYSAYLYRGEKTVGSGLDLIEGKQKSRN